jgi:DNA-binding CsgD family transcriptional regulator
VDGCVAWGSVATMASTSAHRSDVLVARARRAENIPELFDAASERLRQLVPFDGAVWLATDPATSLPTAPTWSDAARFVTSSDDCIRVWELELMVEDVNLFRDLARAETPVRGLRMATSDCPGRSTRYREFLRPRGIDDELRAVLRVDGSVWALIVLLREKGRPAFDAAEAELVASLSGPLAEAVRHHARAARQQLPLGSGNPGPGLMLFAASGELISVNDDAHVWLDELAGHDKVPAGFDGEATFGVRLPVAVVGTLIRARAIAEGRQHGQARARLRSPASGRWIVCHASCLRGPSGEIGNTALVIEPAKASELAPIIVEAYELSVRERQITQLIARGFGTAEIAGRLYLSAHTVRDYVKAVFEKVGVSSRVELVARVFAEHYAPVHFDPRNDQRVGD